ncbi:11152_t:CDS:10, partial [Entrophospora sp. SA101]
DNNMDISVESTPVDSERPMSDVEETTPIAVTDFEAYANKILPELGQEVEDFKYSTWTIKSWKSLDKRTTGPEFEAGGWKWRILLFPSGNNNPDSVSIYLDFADPKGAPAGWHSCVQFALVLWNPEDPTTCMSHHAHHRFTAEESDWGFTRFYDIRKMFQSVDNRTRPFVENDVTNITAFVRVLKDPTGVLWHNFNKYFTYFLSIIQSLVRKYFLLLWPSIFLLTSSYSYDSKKETGYVGLKNQVYQIPTEEDEPVKSVSLALQRVFYQLQTSETPVGTTELTKSFGWDSLDSFMQHDVQEFNRVLQDNLEGKMKNTKADGAITKLFVGKMKSYIKCVKVDYESSHIQLNVKGCKTLRDSFKDYIQEETLEGENKYQAEGYGLQEAKKGVIFESFPPVLHLQLKRFEYDIQRDAMVKINDRHEFPMEIDLEEFLSSDADSGDLHGGHYFALLKPEKDGRWLKFDDDRVTPVTDKEVLEDNYGGESTNNSPLHNLRPGSRNIKRFTNAYMLVYIRESDLDNILSPVIPEDIPEHLQRRLEEEKRFYEQKKKEDEERHLYAQVRLVTEDTFKAHQGFDLANFDERQYPLSNLQPLKVLKTSTFNDFKEKVAAEYDKSPDQIRFWALVNRQNKTVRPDAPIPPVHHNLTMEDICVKFAPLFLKFFDPYTQVLECLGSLYIQKSDKVGEIFPFLCEKKDLPPNTPLSVYEEIKPNMIEEMKPKSTFQQSEIQDGDIICYQRTLTEREYGIIKGILHKNRDPKEFELVLNKKMTYDAVAEEVGTYLNTEPLKLRFTSATGAPKNIIKRTTTQSLTDMIQTTYSNNGTPPLLYYEMLDVSIIELETKKFLKVNWLGTKVKDEELIDIRLVKTAVTKEVMETILEKVTLSEPEAKIRMYEVTNHKIHKEYQGNEPIDRIQDYVVLYAEEIPKEELEMSSDDKIVQVYHFSKEPLHSHGIPFKFVIKAGEVFTDTKTRLQQRLGMNEKEFAKVKVAVVPSSSYPKVTYVEDDQILSEKIEKDEYLGLDHADKTGRAGRVGGAEKAIYIRG